MPPSSSGGVTITETLNILETYDSLPPFGSVGYAHALASAYQRAFIDRNSKLGDPAFVQVPLDKLTSKTYARELRKTIAPDKATPDAGARAHDRRWQAHDALLGRGRRGQRRRDDDDAQQRLRLGRVPDGPGLLHERRDGRLRGAARASRTCSGSCRASRTRSRRASAC